MNFSEFFLSIWKRWRLNGNGVTVCTVNLTFLIMLYALFPIETKLFKNIRDNFFALYPQIDPDKPRLFDPVRIVIQSCYLSLFKARDPTYFRQSQFVFFGRMWDLFYQACYQPLLKLTSRFTNSVRDSKNPRFVSIRHRKLAQVLLVLSFVVSIIAVTQPFSVGYQFIFVGLMWALAMLLRETKNRVALMLMIFISIIISTRYIYWRATKTILTSDVVTLCCAIVLLLAEIYAYLVLILSYFQVSWVLDRKPYPLPEDTSLWPTVDIFIPSYNEPLDVVKPCLLAALGLDWPRDKLNIYMLDDGSRVEFEHYCKEIGVGYIIRQKHDHAKAGNINHALQETNGDLVAIFDCDHVPVRAFLQMTAGWMVHDPNIALVQTPHHFYSEDPFEKNLQLNGEIPAENSLFHDFIQKGNDTWNAVMFCGSCALIRRKPLLEIGGIAVETVTEDAHTSLRLNRRGYSSAFISMPLSAGLATESLADHINQRIRWARGMVQIFRTDNPFKGKGLTMPQRICFANAMIHFLHGLPRIIFLTAPLPYLFFNIYIIFASGLAILAYVLPHMVHSTMTNRCIQGNKRFYFWGVVYETILSWYITVPTLVALIAPKLGKFNVTAKGASNEKTWFDWTVSRPYLLLIVLNFAAFIWGIVRIATDPYAEVITILINLLWVTYNLLVLGAAAAVALEKRQVRASPRIRCEMKATLGISALESFDVVVTDFSKDGLGIKVLQDDLGERKLTDLISNGQEVSVCFDDDANRRLFRGTVRFSGRGRIGLTLRLDGLDEQIDYVRCTFARADRFAHSFENLPQDTLFNGIRTLFVFGLNGYSKMVDNAPYGFREAIKAILWFLLFIFSLLPQPRNRQAQARYKA